MTPVGCSSAWRNPQSGLVFAISLLRTRGKGSWFDIWTYILNAKCCNLSGHSEMQSMNFYDLKKARIEEALLMAHDRRSLYKWLIDCILCMFMKFVYWDAKWSVMRNHISLLQPLTKFPDSQIMGWVSANDPIGVEQICPAFPNSRITFGLLVLRQALVQQAFGCWSEGVKAERCSKCKADRERQIKTCAVLGTSSIFWYMVLYGIMVYGNIYN